MTKKLLLIVGVLAALSFASVPVAHGQLPLVEPEQVGFASEPLSRIEDHFGQRVENGEIKLEVD